MMDTETEKTPLQQKLDEFGQQLSKVWLITQLFQVCILYMLTHVNRLGKEESKDNRRIRKS